MRQTSEASVSTGTGLASATRMGPGQANRAARASRQRAKFTSTGPSAGTGSSSASLCQGSSTIPFSLNSDIDAFLERLETDATVGVDEALAIVARLQIG